MRTMIIDYLMASCFCSVPIKNIACEILITGTKVVIWASKSLIFIFFKNPKSVVFLPIDFGFTSNLPVDWYDY